MAVTFRVKVDRSGLHNHVQVTSHKTVRRWLTRRRLSFLRAQCSLLVLESMSDWTNGLTAARADLLERKARGAKVIWSFRRVLELLPRLTASLLDLPCGFARVTHAICSEGTLDDSLLLLDNLTQGRWISALTPRSLLGRGPRLQRKQTSPSLSRSDYSAMGDRQKRCGESRPVVPSTLGSQLHPDNQRGRSTPNSQISAINIFSTMIP